jgi:hypothetical protein
VKKRRGICAGIWLFALLLLTSAVPAAPQDANFVGTWQVTMEGGSHGGRGGNRHSGGGAQSLTITQDGDTCRVSHKTPRGEHSYDVTVSGNTISWTEERVRRNGVALKINCTATLDGDTLRGTMAGGQFSRGFSAKRSK